MTVEKIESSVSSSFIPNRRAGSDRRSNKTHPFRLESLRGQRHRGRREEDQAGYVDRYDATLRIICIGVLILSSIDAFFTLRILELGGTEVNPVMKFFIEWNLWGFIYFKLFLTTLCIMILVVHTHIKWLNLIKVTHILYGCFAFYLGLIFYELFLLSKAYSVI